MKDKQEVWVLGLWRSSSTKEFTIEMAKIGHPIRIYFIFFIYISIYLLFIFFMFYLFLCGEARPPYWSVARSVRAPKLPHSFMSVPDKLLLREGQTHNS